MNYIINNYQPLSVFHYFEDICKIPRGSYHEEKIADFLVDFAKQRNLFVIRDEKNNVFMRMDASKGYEDKPAILLQGHTDMVCEKDSTSTHNFETDPIDIFLEGEYLGAKGTTLGGDDGIAVAMMLAILDGELPSHPMIECLFTTSEEVGLDGAKAFDYSVVQSKMLINMDSESLGVVTSGCAGGLRSDITISPNWEDFQGNAYEISIKNLMGGHSGENINCGRQNANKLLGFLLYGLNKSQKVVLSSIVGGSKDNAIPRDASAIVSLENPQMAEFMQKIFAESYTLVPEDQNMEVSILPVKAPEKMMDKASSDAIINLIAGTRNGVFSMSKDVEKLVEFSRNMGVIKTENGKVDIVFSTRSALENQLDESIAELTELAEKNGFSSRHYARYPGWVYAVNSKLRDTYLASYEEITGKKASINVIHAGLECGIISSKLPDMDIISIGPDMKDIHSPHERLNLASTETFFKTLAKTIENLCK